MASPGIERLFGVIPLRVKPSRPMLRAQQNSFRIRSRRCLSTESSITIDTFDADLIALTEPPVRSEPLSQGAPFRPPSFVSQSTVPDHIAPSTVTTTIYSFPQLEPQYFTTYPTSHLYLPLRKDLLHKAVVYEGDATRKGLAMTKHRFEIHGINRKLRPQKGTGMARLGDRSSPMLVGGGRAFAKRPRDFSTDLNHKMYDIAWRTALSYRYRMGQLIIVDKLNFEPSVLWIREVLQMLKLGKEHGKSLFIPTDNPLDLKSLMRQSNEGVLEGMEDVDVKDLLKQRRIVIERDALDWILENHQHDLTYRAWKDIS